MINEMLPYSCYACLDFGLIEIFDPSTDGLVGRVKCPKIHPIIWKIYEPIWKMTEKEKAHLPPF